MTTLRETLRKARLNVGITQAELAKRSGVPQSLISSLENGTRQTTRYLPEIAQALGVVIGELEGRYAVIVSESDEVASGNMRRIAQAGNDVDLGYRPPPKLMDERNRMPVYAATEGGDGHLIVSTDEIDRVPRPYTLENIPEAYAILVTGESMVPAYKPGDYAWVNPRLPPMKGQDCILYSVNENDEAIATIKELVTWTQGEWTVRQHNPSRDFKLPRTRWNKYHRVVGNFRR